jgi:hypothetical protein
MIYLYHVLCHRCLSVAARRNAGNVLRVSKPNDDIIANNARSIVPAKQEF